MAFGWIDFTGSAASVVRKPQRSLVVSPSFSFRTLVQDVYAPEPFSEVQARLDAEKASLAGDDVFGRMLPEIGEWPEVADHPFASFLASQAAKSGSPTVDSNELETQLCEPLPLWSAHRPWLNDLSGGDPVAAYAVRAGLVRVSDIPDELRGDARAAERIAFLRSNVPTNEKLQIEKTILIQI